MGMDPSPAFLYIWKLWKAASAARKKSARMGAVRENGGRARLCAPDGRCEGRTGDGRGFVPRKGAVRENGGRARVCVPEGGLHGRGRQVSLRSLTAFFLIASRWGTLGDFIPQTPSPGTLSPDPFLASRGEKQL